MTKTAALSTPSAGAPFQQTTIERRDLRDDDVRIDIEYAGICHSDIHQVREEWGSAIFPMVPGHEIAGVVSEVGPKVTRFKVGDRVGVGCMVDSCGECEQCKNGEEQFCLKGAVMTYNGLGYDGEPTYGGYSQSVPVSERFVCHIPDALPSDEAAPLLCAGITTYAPLKRWGAGPGRQVAVVGMGGLGHMAVKIAAAMGAEVTVLSRTLDKAQDAAEYGARHHYATKDGGVFTDQAGTFDLILNTVSAPLPMEEYMGLLKPFGAMVNVGMPAEGYQVTPTALIGGSRVLAGSMIGGMALTQEMLDFCAEHGVVPAIETLTADQVTEAYDKVVDGDVRYRYVIDVSTIDPA